jgi:hypothetical protein
MSSEAILRVFCVDGPCHGVQHVDLDTGRVLFSDTIEAEYCIYRVDLTKTNSSLAGSFPPRILTAAMLPGPAPASGRADAWAQHHHR